MVSDVEAFFLTIPIQNPDYMCVLLKHLTFDIIEFYNLTELVTPDGYVYIKIKKGMYGLKQADVLAY